MSVGPYWKQKKGMVYFLRKHDITPLAGGGLEVTSGKLSCTIPARFLEAAKKDFGPTDGSFGPTTWTDLVGLTT